MAFAIDWQRTFGPQTAAFIDGGGATLTNCGGRAPLPQNACNFLYRLTIGGTSSTPIGTASAGGGNGEDHLNLFDDPDEGPSFAEGSFGENFLVPSTGLMTSASLNLACKVQTGQTPPPLFGTLLAVASDGYTLTGEGVSVPFDWSACPTTTSFAEQPTFGWMDFAFNVDVTAGEGYVLVLTGAAIGGNQPTYAPTSISGTVPDLTVGTAASTTLSADGNPAPTYAVSADALPAGLTLDPTSGVISGTPSSAGAFSFTITATNTQGSTSQTYTGTVAAAATAPTTTTAPTFPEPAVPPAAPGMIPAPAAVPLLPPGDLPATGSDSPAMLAFAAAVLAAGLALAFVGRRRPAD